MSTFLPSHKQAIGLFLVGEECQQEQWPKDKKYAEVCVKHPFVMVGKHSPLPPLYPFALLLGSPSPAVSLFPPIIQVSAVLVVNLLTIQ